LTNYFGINRLVGNPVGFTVAQEKLTMIVKQSARYMAHRAAESSFVFGRKVCRIKESL
jgi:hypothetical protein